MTQGTKLRAFQNRNRVEKLGLQNTKPAADKSRRLGNSRKQGKSKATGAFKR